MASGKPASETPLWVLAWPIALELLLNYVMGAADTMMISRISDTAAAAVGLSNQVLQAMNMMFIIVNAGAGILIAIHWGAGRRTEAGQTAAIALRVNIVIGLVLSAAILLGRDFILRILNAPPEVMHDARIYLGLAGGGTFLVAVHTAAAAFLRSSGNTRGPMYTAMAMNVLHLILNYTLIFGAAGFPALGTAGVGISTLLSRLFAVTVMLLLLCRAFPSLHLWKPQLRTPALREIMRIGWPITLSNASYSFMQTFLYGVLSTIGVVALSSYTYVNTLQGFSNMIGYSVALAAQIRIGQLYGAGRFAACYRTAYTAFKLGLSFLLPASLLFWIWRRPLIALFTEHAEIAATTSVLLGFFLFLHPLKMMTMGFAQSLYAIGDTRYVTFVGMASMWIFGALGSYMLGIYWNLGIYGVFVALTLDEGTRGFFAWLRWRSRKTTLITEVRATS